MQGMDQISHKDYQATADWLLTHTRHRPKVAIICGSGLGVLADALQHSDSFKYSDIPNFPQSTVQGHAGQLVFGELRGTACVCMKGRFHMYEGHQPAKVTFPIRVFKLLGVKILIVTNAAGSLADDYKTGDVMIIKDHINLLGLAGQNPLIGPNIEQFGPRFPPMTSAYDKDLCKLAMDICKRLGYTCVHKGIYCMVSGPNFETVAEARFLHSLGADAVGMSTAAEVVVAKHCGLRVFGLSLITNQVKKDYSEKGSVNHDDVLGVSKMRAEMLKALVSEMIGQLEINNNIVEV
ncbi:purine nucleoside phosphorylase 4a [Erpetoichthys calabaricus]|uniref:purine nucleoside phosphorylase 4a n=1 Tax=Erpetoichthys calabaricus TaxID=27687 RepID=UPI0010A09206|nr:purine nucleoside phosphorylase 4a [Erpetoichthys calabaricus]